MDIPAEAPDLRYQNEPSSEDEEMNCLVTKLMTYLKLAEAQNKSPERFNSTNFSLEKVDEGRFCDVFTCRDKTTKKEVAVKIFKDTCKKEDIEREVSMLEEISLKNPSSKFNVKFLKQCERDGPICLVFERMEMNLLMCAQWNRLFLHDIRPIATQLFLALDQLKAVNILHADIHPGNIMLVNDKKQPNCVKLIDFGMAIKASDAQPGMELQTLEYRAPEIFLGLPFTEAIDLWGVGCTLAFLYLGHDLFSASSEDQMVKCIVEFLGQPEDHLLGSGKYTERYFIEDEAADGPTWRLREPGQQNNSTDRLSCLDDLIHVEEIHSDRECEDRLAFVDLLKQLLHVDANQRISARQALKHPFITMDHLINHFETHNYLDFQSVMENCPALSEYLQDKSANWTPFQEFPDEEMNCLVTKLMTYLKLAEAQNKSPERFNSTNISLKKVDEGRFCDVFTCCDKTTKKEVAVKIFKDTCKKEDIEREVSMLEEISLKNPSSKFNVKFLKQCERDGPICLVFERMEMNLLMCAQRNRVFLHDIRPIATQLFLALDELKAVNILHADIHPGNIMLVNDKKQPNCVKLIDFGMAIKASDAQSGMDLQRLEYRAPEIFLGLPFTEAIDLWGVGCTLAFLYLGHDLFSASSEDQMVKCIVEFLGQPEDHLLGSGKYTERYFIEDEAADGPTWRLREPGQQNNSTDRLSCLDDLIHVEEIHSDKEYEDRLAFVDLLKQLLHVDANQRISARQALKHPFITMDHLINHFETHNYLDSQSVMENCPALSEYLEDKSANWTPFQEFPVLTTHWDQEGRILLHGSSSSYSVMEKIGRGLTSYVVRCQNNTTKEEVAVKIPKLGWDDPTETELSMLKEINASNPDSNYTIKFLDRCEYRGRTCLVFEMLDMSLLNEVEKHGEMTLHSIRPIAKQLFLVLDKLKALNIQHSDIHEGNIMFVNKQDQPHRVKLIDFGRARKDDEAVDKDNDEYFDNHVYMNTDMSSVGIVLTYLYLGCYVKPDACDIERKIVLCYDSETESLHSLEETISKPSNQEDVHVNLTDWNEELADRMAFADLVKQMLHNDENQRISPSQALQHSFITMDHLINCFETDDYLDASQAIMNELPSFSTDTVKSSSGSPDVTSSEGAEPTGSSGGYRKLLKRIRRFFRVKNSHGLRQPFKDEDLTTESSEGANSLDSTPLVSASSGGFRRLRKRISRLKSYLCCLNPNVED